MEKESGKFGLYIHNLSSDKLFIDASFHIVNKEGMITNKRRTKHVFEPIQTNWGWAEFIPKDVLDNKMETLVDKNGHLTIQLQMTGKIRQLRRVA